MKESDRLFDELGNLRPAQITFAPASVEIRFQLRATLLVILNFPKMLPFRAKRFRKRISQSKRDELRQSRFIAMRQVTAFMPTAKTALEVFDLRRRRPAAFALDQIAHAGIVRRPGTTRFACLTHANIEPEILKRSKPVNAPGADGARLC